MSLTAAAARLDIAGAITADRKADISVTAANLPTGAGRTAVSGAEIGRIPVDSIYSPVLKVTYKVEATRVEQRTDFDRLVLDVETKNSITARDALASAGKTLVELFGLARELNVEAEGIEIGPSPAEADHIASFSLPIEDLELTVRSYNCLKREGVHTVGELVARTESDLLDIRNFGNKSIDEVQVELHKLGLALKDTPADFDPSTIVLDRDHRPAAVFLKAITADELGSTVQRVLAEPVAQPQ